MSNRKAEDAALLAAFLASKKPTQCNPNARTTTERQIYLANRGINPAKPIEPTDSNSVVWRVVTDHLGREFYINQNGEYL